MRAPLATAFVLALAAACAPAPAAPTASSPDGPASPGPGATVIGPTSAPSAAALDPDSIPLTPTVAVRVLVDRLPVRVEPSPEAQEYGLLERGDIAVLMVFSAVEVDGASWWYVEEVRTTVPGKLPELPALLADPAAEYPLVGWIPATGATGETVARLPARCPGKVDVMNVSGMLGGERLSCFGATQITLEGRFACAGCGAGEPGSYEPAWLAGPNRGKLFDPSASDRRLLLWFPPGLTPPSEQQAVRLVGHFDDPAARTCQITYGDTPTPPDIAVQLCRAHFVVDGFEPFKP